MPITPTVWDAWYGQDAHTSYGVGNVVWAGCLYLLLRGVRGMGKMPIPPTVWVRGMGRMPIPPNI